MASFFVARFRQYKARLYIPRDKPMDTPENRKRLLTMIGEMIARNIEGEVRFSSE